MTDSRQVKYLPLSGIQGAEKNPKEHDLEEIRKSIKRRGFVELPAIDGRTGRLVAGHGRIAALVQMKNDGMAVPEGLRAEGNDWLVPVLHGWSSKSEADAAAYLIASNELTKAGGWDDAALNELLGTIRTAGELEGVGYSEADVAKLLGEIEEKKPAKGQPGDLFQVLVEVADEKSQAALLQRLETEGFKCRPLIF